jgi:uncharacterized protein (TIGR03437 family)
MRLTLSLLCFSTSLCWATLTPVAERTLADLPVTFERNQGQWPRDVEFAAHIGGHRYTFAGKDIIIDGNVHLDLISSPRGKLEALDPVETKTNYLRGSDPKRWVTGVQNYSRLRRRNAIPGIDLILYGSHGQLEFDYTVAPGASLDAIHFRVQGAKVESVFGNLKLTTPSGLELDLRAPKAYQGAGADRKAVDCRYWVNNRGEIAFTTSHLDPLLPLLIDPVLSYLGVVQGTNFSQTQIFPTVTDSDGSFYLGGTTFDAPGLPITIGALRPATPCKTNIYAGCVEAWVIKLTPNGQIAWGTYFGVTNSTAVLTMALDPSGNVVIGGDTGSPNFPVTSDAYLSKMPPPDALGGVGFLAELNPTGSALVYSTYLEHRAYVMTIDSHGATYFSDGTAIQKLSPDRTVILYTIQTPGIVSRITTDDSGNLYAISGPSPGFPVTPGAYSSTDNDRLFILKFDPKGNQLFAARFNAPALATAPPISQVTHVDIAVDPTGNIVFTGQAGIGVPVVSDPDPQPNDCDSEYPCMAYVAALDSTGSHLLYSRLLGHGGGQKLAFGANGDVYVAGSTYAFVAGVGYGSDFPRTFDAFRYCSYPTTSSNSPGPVAAANGFILRLNSQGRRAFSSFLGTPYTTVTDLQLAPNGTLYVGGYVPDGGVATTNGSCCRGYFAVVIDTTLAPHIPHACLVNATQNVEDGPDGISVAPGQMVTLFGEGLGPQIPAPAEWNVGGSLSNSLAGVQVLFDGIPAPMLYAQANQLNCIVPFGVAANKTTSVVVQYAGNQTDPMVLNVLASLPDIFTNGYLPGSDALAINQDGTLNSADHPAPRGSIVTFYATGLGQTSPPLKDGQIAPVAAPAAPGVGVVFFTPDIELAEVIYQGTAPGQVAGFYQLNVRIPANVPKGHTQVEFSAAVGCCNYYTSTEGIWLQ